MFPGAASLAAGHERVQPEQAPAAWPERLCHRQALAVTQSESLPRPGRCRGAGRVWPLTAVGSARTQVQRQRQSCFHWGLLFRIPGAWADPGWECRSPSSPLGGGQPWRLRGGLAIGSSLKNLGWSVPGRRLLGAERGRASFLWLQLQPWAH